METTTIIAFVVFALLIAQGLLPRRFKWPLMWLAILVAGGFVIVDTPTIAWPLKLGAWLVLVGIAFWRWNRERSTVTAPA